MYSSLVSQSLYPLSDLPLTTLTMRNSIPNKTLEKCQLFSSFLKLKKKKGEGRKNVDIFEWKVAREKLTGFFVCWSW
jgi:hypothetical protein